MSAEDDPREWLRAEEKEIARIRRRAEQARSHTRRAAIVLWVAALLVAAGVLAALAWFGYRNRRLLRRLIQPPSASAIRRVLS